ncbi:MAG: cell division protease FtsH [Frankiales bacterium]|jgi:cell division protease FtsH|nr:cell division protease FtsH [Frankiales bacterium]
MTVVAEPSVPSAPDAAPSPPPAPGRGGWLKVLGGLGARLRGRLPRGARGVLVVLLLALICLGYAGVRSLRPVSEGRQTGLTELLAMGDRGEVTSAVLYDQDSRVVAHTILGTFTASYPHSDTETSAIVRQLSSNGTVRVDSQFRKSVTRFGLQFLFPILVLGTLFGLLMTAGRGEGGAREYAEFSKVRAGAALRTDGPRRRKGVPLVGFADVAGNQSAVTELKELVDYLREPERFSALGAVPPKGVLLFGPPGCGKTLLARAVAGEAGVPFFSLSGSEFVESLVGVGAARVRDLFSQVRAKAPAILFIDELDAAGRKRGAGVGGGNDEREQTLNQMLVEMDGFDPVSGVVVIGATNRPDILDPALLRPGRFDRHVTVERPDLEGRFDILRLYAAGRPVADDVDLEVLARRTPGFTGADLENVWREAALLAVRAGATQIRQVELDEAVQRVLAGPKRSGASLNDDERRLVAVHEAGHAVVAAATGQAAQVERVSIARRGIGLGHASVLREDRLLLRRSECITRLARSLAGKAAEEIVYGEASTGAEGDIEAATDLARDMAGRWGMSEGIGPVRVSAKDAEVFLGRDLAAMASVSPETLDRLDSEIRTLVEEGQRIALTALANNRELLLTLADVLEAAETVDGPELRELLEQATPWDSAPQPRRRVTRRS